MTGSSGIRHVGTDLIVGLPAASLRDALAAKADRVYLRLSREVLAKALGAGTPEVGGHIALASPAGEPEPIIELDADDVGFDVAGVMRW